MRAQATFYFALKVVFYVWAAYGGGAAWVYANGISPLFDKIFPAAPEKTN